MVSRKWLVRTGSDISPIKNNFLNSSWILAIYSSIFRFLLKFHNFVILRSLCCAPRCRKLLKSQNNYSYCIVFFWSMLRFNSSAVIMSCDSHECCFLKLRWQFFRPNSNMFCESQCWIMCVCMLCSISFQVAVWETGLQFEAFFCNLRQLALFENWYYFCCELILGKITGIVRALEDIF